MKKIQIEVSKFNSHYSKINGNYDLKFNNFDLIRAVLSIGHSDWRSVLKGGRIRLLELIYEATGTIAYIGKNKGNLVLNDSFYKLDPSDKNPISYRLGMGVTKLVAEKLLNIPWLLNVDKLRNEGIATTTAGTNERGDLAGLDIDLNWHVLEAKGRSNTPANKDIIKGKNQAGRIKTINSRTPETKSICMSYFNKIDTITQFIDPINGENEIPTKWDIRPDDYLKSYYKIFLNELENNKKEFSYKNININNQVHQFMVFHFQEYTFSIGIYLPLIQSLENYSLNTFPKFKELQGDILEDIRDDKSMSIGLDGIAIFDLNKHKNILEF